MIGGQTGGFYNNDTWSSADGITWTRPVAVNAFGGRTLHNVITFNNKIWVIGGAGINPTNSAVWYSE